MKENFRGSYKRIIALLICMTIAFSLFIPTLSANAATITEQPGEIIGVDPDEPLTGSLRWMVTGYDWGPAVNKIIIKLNYAVSATAFDTSYFTVRAGTNANPTTNRPITDAYPSDAQGFKVDGASNYLTIELQVAQNVGTPFTYNMTSGFNSWTANYQHIVLLNKPLLGNSSWTITNDVTSGPFGRYTPESDRWQMASGTYSGSRYTTTYNWAWYTPPEAAGGKRPLIIWLHGAGEGGTDPRITLYGNKIVNLASDAIQSVFGGAFVLTPQAPTYWMNNGNNSYTSNGYSMYTESLMAMIKDFVKNTPNIDKERIYISGCSNGGYMTNRMTADYPEYFAAAVPICSAMTSTWLSDAEINGMKYIPTYFVHAQNDTTARPATSSVLIYNRLIAAGAPNCHYFYPANVSPYMGHWSWVYWLNNQAACDADSQTALSNCTGQCKGKTAMDWLNLQSRANHDAGNLPERLEGSLRWMVTGYDWGPAVNKIILKLNVPVTEWDFDASYFTVRAGTNANPTTNRPITGAYVSDAQGNEVVGAGSYVTLELQVAQNVGTPFTYNMTSGFNSWTANYQHIVLLNKPLRGYSAWTITNDTSSGPFGRYTPESDRWQMASGTYSGSQYTTLYNWAWYTPPEAASSKRPLIIWLHGAGEGGTDPRITLYGNKIVNLASDQIQSVFGGAYVLTPQAPTYWMNNGNNAYTTNGFSMYTESLMAMIDDFVKNTPNIDKERIYLSGCSNGGYMTNRMTATYPLYFAAAVPICSAMTSTWLTDAEINGVKHIPTYFVHAQNDTTARPATSSVLIYNRLIAAGAPNCHYFYPANVSPYMGHWSWVYWLNDQAACDADKQTALSNCTGQCNGHTAMEWLNEQIRVRLPVTSIKINATASKAVERGETYTFDVNLNKEALSDRIVWSVNNSLFANVNTVEGVATVTILNKTGTVVLTATDPVNGMSHSIILRIT